MNYNYERFDEYVESGQDGEEFSSFFDRLHAGDDAALTALNDGATVRLSELWESRDLVISSAPTPDRTVQ